ncbi:hypothetical protein Sdia_09360 [Streptomyces diastaticus subsp. diastaticus]|uniref:Uncharacterized protein n=1 Tax=Streptomyces diastaticus subsp. diastaticus TaxID=68040 RepID=A0ABQ1CJ60_STRDI|nr:hypothetical protein Sdia_09360 [Streptomyces diastaticus subsp. diastaticus]GGU15578.1 hypothetical protein GCM10015534_17820 [Streptomyces diastaticus subsp. diastaticus]
MDNNRNGRPQVAVFARQSSRPGGFPAPSSTGSEAEAPAGPPFLRLPAPSAHPLRLTPPPSWLPRPELRVKSPRTGLPFREFRRFGCRNSGAEIRTGPVPGIFFLRPDPHGWRPGPTDGRRGTFLTAGTIQS